MDSQSISRSLSNKYSKPYTHSKLKHINKSKVLIIGSFFSKANRKENGNDKVKYPSKISVQRISNIIKTETINQLGMRKYRLRRSVKLNIEYNE